MLGGKTIERHLAYRYHSRFYTYLSNYSVLYDFWPLTSSSLLKVWIIRKENSPMNADGAQQHGCGTPKCGKQHWNLDRHRIDPGIIKIGWPSLVRKCRPTDSPSLRLKTNPSPSCHFVRLGFRPIVLWELLT